MYRKILGKITKHTHSPENESIPAAWFSCRPRRRPTDRRTGVGNRTGSSTACRTRTISSATYVRFDECYYCHRNRKAFSNSRGTTCCRSRSAGRRPRRCRRPAGVPPTRYARASRTPSDYCLNLRRRTGSADI